MVEYCYPECTTSVITSLAIFRKFYPDYRTKEIKCVSFFLSYEIALILIADKPYNLLSSICILLNIHQAVGLVPGESA
jgi:hypothetical protein